LNTGLQLAAQASNTESGLGLPGTLTIVLLGLFQMFQGFMQYRQVNRKE